MSGVKRNLAGGVVYANPLGPQPQYRFDAVDEFVWENVLKPLEEYKQEDGFELTHNDEETVNLFARVNLMETAFNFLKQERVS
jgi:hypothetical protein